MRKVNPDIVQGRTIVVGTQQVRQAGCMGSKGSNQPCSCWHQAFPRCRACSSSLAPVASHLAGAFTVQGLYARVRRLAEPLLRLRSTKDDGTVLETEYPLEEGLLAAVRWGWV